MRCTIWNIEQRKDASQPASPFNIHVRRRRSIQRPDGLSEDPIKLKLGTAVDEIQMFPVWVWRARRREQDVDIVIMPRPKVPKIRPTRARAIGGLYEIRD